MTEDSHIPDSETTGLDPNALRDADGHINALWLGRLRALLAAGEQHDVIEMMAPLHTSDTGDVIEVLDPDERVTLVQLLGDRFDYTVLTEVDDTVRTDLMEELPNADIARGVSNIDSDDAVYILEDIDVPDREEILAQMPAFERLSLSILDTPRAMSALGSSSMRSVRTASSTSVRTV